MPEPRDEEADWPPEREAPATSGKAIASLVLGLLSFCLWFFAGIPAILLGILSLRDINRSRGRLQGQGLAVAGIVTGIVGALLLSLALLPALLLPAVSNVRKAANRMQDQNNLKQIGIGFHAYYEAYGRFPPAVLRDPDGEPYSWRVALLPFVEGEMLYRQYNRQEPWNSAHNQQVLNQMPRVYLSPADVLGTSPAGPSTTLTHYQVLVGPGAAFEGEEGMRIADFRDGTSDTLLVVEAADPVPWTQPTDLDFDPSRPLPRLGGQFGSGFNAAFADGSVRFIPQSTSEQTLRAMITRNGGEVVNLP